MSARISPSGGILVRRSRRSRPGGQRPPRRRPGRTCFGAGPPVPDRSAPEPGRPRLPRSSSRLARPRHPPGELLEIVRARRRGEQHRAKNREQNSNGHSLPRVNTIHPTEADGRDSTTVSCPRRGADSMTKPFETPIEQTTTESGAARSRGRGARRARCWRRRATTAMLRSTTTPPRRSSASRAARSRARPISASSCRSACSVWGARWLEQGCLSAHYRNTCYDGDEVRAFRHAARRRDPHARSGCSARTAREVLRGTASVGERQSALRAGSAPRGAQAARAGRDPARCEGGACAASGSRCAWTRTRTWARSTRSRSPTS